MKIHSGQERNTMRLHDGSEPASLPAVDRNITVESNGCARLSRPRHRDLAGELGAFREFGRATRTASTSFADPEGNPCSVPVFVNEFWTSKQRQANPLHEISYRACFKPQLPRFFIERLTVPGETVYDPFMGRGTTPLEAALLGRVPYGNDANPLSISLTLPRLRPPTVEEVAKRLQEIDLNNPADEPPDLLAFYHPDTLRAISSLKNHFIRGQRLGTLDDVDRWIEMVSLNRLTGHSQGFFSVFTMPPNQAVSVRAQRVINERRKQTPPRRDVVAIILKKTRQLLKSIDPLRDTLASVASHALLLTSPAQKTPQIASGSVSLAVTSPPFLSVVNYRSDNWLRCWFLGIDPGSVELTLPSRVEAWQQAMTSVMRELRRVLKPGGHIAFEVGEVNQGKTKLEEAVLPCAMAAGLDPVLVVINDQTFTKTANCWGVSNMERGTNTNRIVVMRRP